MTSWPVACKEKNSSSVPPEAIFRYGLMAIALLVMVAELHNLVEYFFVGLLVAWFGVRIHRRDFHFVRTPLDLPIVLFVVWVALTIPFSVDPEYSFAEWRKTVLQISMFYFVVNVVSNEKDVRHVLYAFMLGVIALSAFGIVDHLARGENLFDKTSHMASLASSGTWLSIAIVMGLPFLWLFWQEGEGRHATLSIGFLFVMIMIALFLTHVRGTWVAFIAQLAVFWLMVMKKKWLKWSGVAVFCGLIFAGGYLVYQHNFVLQTSAIDFLNLHSVKVRLDYWQIAVDQILAHPILGYGYGDYIFPKVNETITEATMALSKYPVNDHGIHNAWLKLAYGTGFPGLIIFASLLFVTIRTVMKGLKERRGTFMGNFSFCVFLMIVGVVTAHIFGNTFVGSLAYLFWLLTGLYFALKVHQDTSSRASEFPAGVQNHANPGSS